MNNSPTWLKLPFGSGGPPPWLPCTMHCALCTVLANAREAVLQRHFKKVQNPPAALPFPPASLPLFWVRRLWGAAGPNCTTMALALGEIWGRTWIVDRGSWITVTLQLQASVMGSV